MKTEPLTKADGCKFRWGDKVLTGRLIGIPKDIGIDRPEELIMQRMIQCFDGRGYRRYIIDKNQIIEGEDAH